jgi:hypothetical protein
VDVGAAERVGEWLLDGADVVVGSSLSAPC